MVPRGGSAPILTNTYSFSQGKFILLPRGRDQYNTCHTHRPASLGPQTWQEKAIFMTVDSPEDLAALRRIGRIVALTVKSAIDDPTRFARSKDVGPWVGLTPRRTQSGF